MMNARFVSWPRAFAGGGFATVERWVARCRVAMRLVAADCNANVTLISAVSLIPTLFGLGFCIDYSRAQMLQSRIDAVADAAALTATDALYLNQAASVAQAAATQVFTNQVTDYADFTFNASTQLTVQLSNAGAINNGRSAYVGWIGQSTNMFSGILGSPSFSISGSATAYAALAPNVNFFLVMDRSSSMLLPTTSTGVTEVQGATSGACAFACHQKFPGQGYIKDVNGKSILLDANYYNAAASSGYQTYYLTDSSGNIYNSSGTTIGNTVNTSLYTTAAPTVYYFNTSHALASVTGYWADGYWLTHNYTKAYPSGSAIDLRVSDETAAAQALIPYAQGQATTNGVTYQMQFFSYDWTHPSASSPVTQWNSMVNVNSLTTASVPNLDSNVDYWIYNSTYSLTCCSQGDATTENYNMLTSMNSAMPAPGTGTTSASPQEVMLIITDGVTDELIGGSRTNREFNSSDLGACTAIKNRGIKIAILYTTYDPSVIANDGWSVANVTPYLPNVLPALQSCASVANNGSPLVYSVQSNQSITTALQTLFQLTLVNSHLTG